MSAFATDRKSVPLSFENDVFSYGEMNDLLPGSTLLDMDHSLDVLFATAKEQQPIQEFSISDSGNNANSNMLPNEPVMPSFNSEAALTFSITKQEPPPSPVVKIEKEKNTNKRKQSQTASNRPTNKRKKMGTPRQEESINPLYQINCETQSVQGRYPIGTILERSSVSHTNSPRQSYLLPNPLTRQVSQWNPQSAPMHHPVQIRPLTMQVQNAPPIQHVSQGLRSIQPSPDPNMKMILPNRREYSSTSAFPGQTDEYRAIYPSRGSSVSPDDVQLSNSELRSDSGSGSLQQVEGLTRRASDSTLYRKISEPGDISNYNPVNRNESTTNNAKLKPGRVQQRDSQVLLHIVGMKEPFGMIAIERGSDRVDYARKMVEKHFADVVGKRHFIFLSHDGVLIKRSQEKELLVWNQTYEKVWKHHTFDDTCIRHHLFIQFIESTDKFVSVKKEHSFSEK